MKKIKVGEKTFLLKSNEIIEKSFSDQGVDFECTPAIISTQIRLPILKTNMFNKWPRVITVNPHNLNVDIRF